MGQCRLRRLDDAKCRRQHCPLVVLRLTLVSVLPRRQSSIVSEFVPLRRFSLHMPPRLAFGQT